ncbi:MAG TPA: YggT family protein [Acidimicrobiia bacterium]|nr:YggT family protein [Acidimicrobiia bacterium]
MNDNNENNNNNAVERPEKSIQAIGVQIVRIIASIIGGLLAIRFILSALGANKANGFADFIYSITEPLVRPFYGLFNNEIIYDNGRRLEYEAIIALIVYSLIAYVIIRILAIGKKESDVL